MFSVQYARALTPKAQSVRNLTIHFISKLGYVSSLLVIIPDYFQATEPQTRLQVMEHGKCFMFHLKMLVLCFLNEAGRRTAFI